MSNLDKYQKQCLERLIWSTQELGVEVEETALAKIAEMIVQTMTGPWRYFHTPDHIFEVGGSEDAIEVLAALFHDLVYVQIDHSVKFSLTSYLTPFIQEKGDKLLIRESTELPVNSIFDLVMVIFGFVPGQVLSPLSGQNEFLSAIVAAKSLEPLLETNLIVPIIACIEATIPFRYSLEDGLTPSDRLYKRLLKINYQFNLGLTDPEIIATVKRSVRLTNRDIGGFSAHNPGRFIDNTWSLLPETNHYLKNPNSYTVQEYRIAIQKMERFLNFLTPEKIFPHFQGEPDQQTYQGFLDRGKKNLEIGRLYLGTKLVAIAIIEALSWRFSRDISLATMMGELPSSEDSVGRLVDFLPAYIPNAYQPQTDIENEVLDLLEKGRSQESNYDIKDSPLATFIVKSIGFEQITNLLEQGKEFFQRNISNDEFLDNCNADLLNSITNAIGQLMDNRKAALCRS